jgi:hypothetical protein
MMEGRNDGRKEEELFINTRLVTTINAYLLALLPFFALQISCV